MQVVKNPFVKVINGDHQFIIPVFQRDYSWTTEQCQQFWDDVLRTGRNGDDAHFLGSFVYAEGDVGGAAFTKWLVIDGQQRLTTLSLLLAAVRDHIAETDWHGDDPTSDRIDAYYLKNLHEPGSRRYKLALRRHDDETLRALLDGNDPDDVTNRSEMIVDAYEFFLSQLNACNGDIAEIYRGIRLLNVVDVRLERHIDNPQLVFESLNSTGVDLTESDLIRNYLLMGLPEPEQTRMYEKYWSEIETLFRDAGNSPDAFLRDFVAIKRKTNIQIRADRIYTEFKEFWQKRRNQLLDDRFEDMVRSARYYAYFLKPERIENGSIKEAMIQARQLGVVVHATLVMRLYECYQKNSLEQDDFVTALNLIESFLVRRSVLQLQTRNYWSVFARMAHSIDDDNPLASLRVALARQSYRFPSDQEFETAVQERDLYSLRVCWHILSQLENAGYKEPSPTREYSVEHIMPQTIVDVPEWRKMLGEDWEINHSSWVNRLGNLTLTAYNSTYSNRPFHEKKSIKGGFAESALRLNGFVGKQVRWTVNEIQERGQLLARRAVEVWPNHGADTKMVAEDKLRELRSKSAEKNMDSLEMRSSVRSLMHDVQDTIRQMGECVEVVERQSLCYYDSSANFLAETLPMSRYVRILIPIDFEETYDPEEIAGDVTRRKFLPYVVHRDCGVFIDVWEQKQIPAAEVIIRQALQIAQE